MIKSFSCKYTKELFIKGKSKKVPTEIQKVALRKLDYLNSAISLDDLLVPPGNRLEALKGDLAGKYSIRINRQFCIVFGFSNGNAYDVEIVDYH